MTTPSPTPGASADMLLPEFSDEQRGSGACARVVPEVSLDKAFDYEVPEHLIGQVRLGSKVLVPFGHRSIVGYVIALMPTSAMEGLKPIEQVLGTRPIIPPSLIQMAAWMSEYYCAPLAQCFRCIMPEAVRRRDAGHKQRLWVAPIPGITLESGREKISAGAKSQRHAWDFIVARGGGWLAELLDLCPAGPAAWRALADKNLVTIDAHAQERDPFANQHVATNGALTMNDEQAKALAQILAETAKPKPQVVLLHGVTGSGKTEVYLQAIAKVIDEGKNAIVLVPEIALTPQTVDRFRARFAGQHAAVAVMHSNLSAGERHDQWQQMRSGRARIAIGARSAVFAPIENLGIIVVDEEHETSYKQDDSPHYHARDCAVMRGHLEKVAVVLGSATPSLESYWHAQEGKYLMAPLTKRVEVLPMPTMHIVDMRMEYKKTGKNALLSTALTSAVQQRLDKGEQTIIFLNRRGYATSLQCPQCGHVEMCPHCSVPLTFHRASQKVCCHLCDHSSPVPMECPSCHFKDYRYAGIGTEKVEESVQEAFPKGNLARMDSDTMRGKDAYRRTLKSFADGDIDILVGTQMIAKGLHFPSVTCVGVVNSDLALQLPDFRASERVFQVLMQVAGRSGRGQEEGDVYVQTRTPFHPAIQYARHHDYEGFAEQELEFRRALHYPPFLRAILITFRGRDDDKTRFVAEQVTRQVTDLLGPEAEVTGPGLAPIAKIKDHHRYHLFLRADKLPPVVRKLRPLFVDAEWPDGIRVTVDVDPMMIM